MKIKIDFRIKLLLTIVLSVAMLLGNLQEKCFPLFISAIALPFLLLFINKNYLNAFSGVALILLALLFNHYLIGRVKGPFVGLVLIVTITVFKLAPGFMMAKYTFSSTDMGQIVQCLKKIYLPDSLIIPISVMARFFYTVKIDYKQINDAMYLHGLTFRKLFFHPFKLFEYKFVPLLMLLTRTADEVSISALTRGLRVGEKRSSLYECRLHLIDYFFLLFSLSIIVVNIWSVL